MNALDLELSAVGPTSEDLFLGGALTVRQPRKGYRAGIDALLLAATVRPEMANVGPVLDLGAGAGIVGLCVAVRCPAAQVVLIEREPHLVTLARHNIDRNGLSGRVSIVEADISRATAALECAGVASESFATVLANPPYHEKDRSTAAGSRLKATSHQMPKDELDAWARFMCRMAAPGGRASMIHKAEALPQILASFEGRFGNMTVLPIYARAREPAIRVIVSGIKGSRAPLAIKPALVLHGPNQTFLPEVEAILRDGSPLAPEYGV
jgi:FkbM family methyltransferase